MMKHLVLAVLATAGTVVYAADAGLMPADRDFINKAAQGHMMEVAAGKLASQRALDLNVKQFGERMVSDHSAALDALKKVADSKQMPMPDATSKEGNDTIGKLETLTGSDFDKQYSKLMVKDHTMDIAEFQKETRQKGADPDVKAYAEQTLPTLQHHLTMAKELAGNH